MAKIISEHSVQLWTVSQLEDMVQNNNPGGTGRQNGNTYSCECGKTYTHSASLYNHKTYNCGKKPQFQCPYCPAKSSRKGNLKSHIIAKHTDKIITSQHVVVNAYQ